MENSAEIVLSQQRPIPLITKQPILLSPRNFFHNAELFQVSEGGGDGGLGEIKCRGCLGDLA